jgi:hypothetical protein
MKKNIRPTELLTLQNLTEKQLDSEKMLLAGISVTEK